MTGAYAATLVATPINQSMFRVEIAPLGFLRLDATKDATPSPSTPSPRRPSLRHRHPRPPPVP